MTLRANPGRRLAIERELSTSPFLADALSALCALWGIDPSGWQQVPALQEVFETAAASIVAERLRAEGQSEAAARREAHRLLGIPPSTVRNRIERWYRMSRGVSVMRQTHSARNPAVAPFQRDEG
jgi:hypothetical protein